MILLDTFIGRFHPLVVHLPIGFLVLGIVTEWFYRSEKVKPFVVFSWLMGGVSAFFAVLFGWLLANEGGYEEGSLFWHRWLGIALTVFAFGVYFVKSGRIELGNLGHQVLNLGALALLTIVGHLGGNMTHGSDYLIENAPTALKAILGSEATEAEAEAIDKPADSIYLYTDLIEPVFEAKCMQCHNNEVQRGALNMSSPAKLALGGDHGVVLVAGSAEESELFRRVTLLPDHAKYMPLKGQPMTFQEIKLMEWWLEEGASFEARLTEYEVPKDMASILLKQYEVDVSEKPYYEKVKVNPAEEQVLEKIRNMGFKVETLGAGNNLLEVSYRGQNIENIEVLLEAAAQITWLDLSNTQITDEQINTIGKLPNLTRLRLQNNPIGDEGVAALSSLKHLESLNLHHTQVTNAVATTLGKIVGLKRVYLWETQATLAILSNLQAAKPELEVDLGIQYASINTGAD